MVSLLFNLTILSLWATNFGNVYTGQLGGPELQASISPGESNVPEDGSEKVREQLRATEGLPKGKRPNAVLTVRVSDADAAQPMIEAIIEPDTKVWHLVDTRADDDSEVTLEYLIRKKKPVPAATLVDKLEGQGAPHVLGVEYREIAGAE
jgi:hypothetical protein